MDGPMDGWMADGWMNRWMDGPMNGWSSEWMDRYGPMNRWMDR